MKLNIIFQKIRQSKLAERIQGSRLVMTVDRLTAVCKRNPVPIQCIFALVYRLVLDAVYLTALSPVYTYAGFTTDIFVLQYILSWLVVLILVPMIVSIQQKEQRPSSILVTLLNYLYFIPMTSYIGCKGSTFGLLIDATIYWTVLLTIEIKLPTIQLKRLQLHHTDQLFKWITLAAVVLVMAVSGYYTGFRVKLNMSDVYTVRAEAAAYSMPVLISYALSMMKVLLPIIILYWLQAKKWLRVLALLIVYVFYYSIAAQKSVFMLLFLMLGGYFFYRNWMMRYFGAILSAGVLVCGLLYSMFGILDPMSLLVRRLMYLPVQLSEVYREFFSSNPLDMFRESIVGKLGFDSMYSDGMPKVIGEFMNTGSNANNGMLGDMYANLPTAIGVFIMPFVVILCFRLLNICAEKLPTAITISICVNYGIGFANGAWSTILLSHGLLLACFLLYIFPIKKGAISK